MIFDLFQQDFLHDTSNKSIFSFFSFSRRILFFFCWLTGLDFASSAAVGVGSFHLLILLHITVVLWLWMYYANKVEGGGQVRVMRNLDINQVPSEEDCWTAVSVEVIDDYDDGNNNAAGGPPRKKLRLTKEQSRLLEESFRHNHTLNPVC